MVANCVINFLYVKKCIQHNLSFPLDISSHLALHVKIGWIFEENRVTLTDSTYIWHLGIIWPLWNDLLIMWPMEI